MTSNIRPDESKDDERKQTIWTANLLDLAKRAGIVWAVGLLIILLVVGVGYAISVLLLAFAGVLLAILIRSLSDFLSTRTGIGEKWSAAVMVLLLVALVGAGIWLLAPEISEQIDELRQSLPKSVEQLEGKVKRYEWGRWMLEKSSESAELIPKRRDLFGSITGIVSGTLGAVGTAFVIFFTGLFLAIQPRLYIEGIVKLVTIQKRDRAREVIGQIGAGLRWWLVAKLTAMVFVGGLTWLGLWLLGIEIALTLAVLAAFLTFIPNFGPIIAAVPAVLLGLQDGLATAVWVAALYISIQTIESYLVTPLLQQQTVSLPPALTITAQLAMAVFVGGIGLALATPLTVVLMVLVRSLYVQDTLGDEA